MTDAFSYRSQKVLQKYGAEPEIAPIIKDLANAKQGIVSFSKEVKKYMLGFIHAKYDNDEEVKALIELLRSSSRYESFNYLEIFKLQDESYFWYEFLTCYALWKIIGKTYGFASADESYSVLVRLCRYDTDIFKEYAELLK